MGQGADTKERILNAALETFASLGFEGARMEKIASEVGINKASLYFHFKSKEEIFRELFKRIVEKYQIDLNRMLEKAKALPSRQRLVSIYKDYLEYHWHNTEMDFWNMVYYYPPVMMKEEIIHITLDNSNAFINDLTAIMEDGVNRKELQPLNARSMAMSYYYLLTCISLSTDLMDKEQCIHNMDECFEIYWNGIKGI